MIIDGELQELTNVELDYYEHLFKNQSALESGQHDLNQIYYKARSKLKNLMKELLLEDKFEQLDNQYSHASSEKAADTLIKLLFRC